MLKVSIQLREPQEDPLVSPAPSFSLLTMVFMDCMGHVVNTNPCRSRYHVSFIPHLVQLEYLIKEQRLCSWVCAERDGGAFGT